MEMEASDENEVGALMATVVYNEPEPFKDYELHDKKDSWMTWLINKDSILLYKVLILDQRKLQFYAKEQSERKFTGPDDWSDLDIDEGERTKAYVKNITYKIQPTSENRVSGEIQLDQLPTYFKPSYFVVRIPSSLKNAEISIEYNVVGPYSQKKKIQLSVKEENWDDQGNIYRYALVMTDSMWPLEHNRKLEALLVDLHSNDNKRRFPLMQGTEQAEDSDGDISDDSDTSILGERSDSQYADPTIFNSSSSSYSYSSHSSSKTHEESVQKPSTNSSRSSFSDIGALLEVAVQPEVSITQPEKEEGETHTGSRDQDMSVSSMLSSAADYSGSNQISMTEQNGEASGSTSISSNSANSISVSSSELKKDAGTVENSITITALTGENKNEARSSSAEGEGSQSQYTSDKEEDQIGDGEDASSELPPLVQRSTSKKKNIERMTPFLSIIPIDGTIRVEIEGQSDTTLDQTVLLEVAGLSFEEPTQDCGCSA